MTFDSEKRDGEGGREGGGVGRRRERETGGDREIGWRERERQ